MDGIIRSESVPAAEGFGEFHDLSAYLYCQDACPKVSEIDKSTVILGDGQPFVAGSSRQCGVNLYRSKRRATHLIGLAHQSCDLSAPLLT